jgi:hypothetical protein
MSDDTMIKRWTTRVLYALASIAALVAARDKLFDTEVLQWAGLVSAALLAIAAQIERQRPPRSPGPPPGRSSSAGALLLFFCAIGMSGCGGNLTTGYRSLYAVERAGEVTDQALGQAIENRRKDCRAESSTAEAYETCMSDYVQAGRTFERYVKPGINTALESTFAMLEQMRKSGKEQDWRGRLKSGLCPLVRVLEEWEHMLGDDAEMIMTWVRLVQGVACDE